jgi:hypothetical protein
MIFSLTDLLCRLKQHHNRWDRSVYKSRVMLLLQFHQRSELFHKPSINPKYKHVDTSFERWTSSVDFLFASNPCSSMATLPPTWKSYHGLDFTVLLLYW